MGDEIWLNIPWPVSHAHLPVPSLPTRKLPCAAPLLARLLPSAHKGTLRPTPVALVFGRAVVPCEKNESIRARVRSFERVENNAHRIVELVEGIAEDALSSAVPVFTAEDHGNVHVAEGDVDEEGLHCCSAAVDIAASVYPSDITDEGTRVVCVLVRKMYACSGSIEIGWLLNNITTVQQGDGVGPGIVWTRVASVGKGR